MYRGNDPFRWYLDVDIAASQDFRYQILLQLLRIEKAVCTLLYYDIAEKKLRRMVMCSGEVIAILAIQQKHIHVYYLLFTLAQLLTFPSPLHR